MLKTWLIMVLRPEWTFANSLHLKSQNSQKCYCRLFKRDNFVVVGDGIYFLSSYCSIYVSWPIHKSWCIDWLLHLNLVYSLVHEIKDDQLANTGVLTGKDSSHFNIHTENITNFIYNTVVQKNSLVAF